MEQNERNTIEQNLHNLAIQRQTVQQQLMEAELALKELGGATNAYRIVHGLLIQAPVPSLTEELEKKKEVSQNRLASIEHQEAKLKAKLQ